MLRKIKGKGGSLSLNQIEKNGKEITQSMDIANTAVKAIS